MPAPAFLASTLNASELAALDRTAAGVLVTMAPGFGLSTVSAAVDPAFVSLVTAAAVRVQPYGDDVNQATGLLNPQFNVTKSLAAAARVPSFLVLRFGGMQPTRG